MKKHQKFLVGLMILGLAGGVGTAFALNYKDASGTTHSEQTDQAIYLYWGTDEQNTAVKAEVKELEKDTAQYRCLVVAPQASKSLSGTVTVNFGLVTGGDNYELPGLTVAIYSTANYQVVKPTTEGETTAIATLEIGKTTTYEATFAVEPLAEKANHTVTKYYVLEFLWDGTGVSSANKTFGGSLKISQSFAKTEAAA